MRRWPLLLLLVLSTLAPSIAFAQDGRSEVERIRAAAEEFDAGRRAFTAGDYTTAAEHFEKADRDAPAPEALRMAIRARMAAKQYDRVATLATSALERYPDDEATVAFAKEMLAKVPKRLHRLIIRCDEPCGLVLDRRVTPFLETTQATLFVEPGEHEVAAGWSQGRTRKQKVDAEPAGETELRFTAPPLPAPEPPEPAPRPAPDEGPSKAEEASGLPPGVFYGALGVTTVLTGVTVWSGLDMRANPGKDKVREDCAGQDESCPTYQDALDSQKRTNVLLVSTGVAAVGTVLLGTLFTDWSDDPEPERSHDRIEPVVVVGRGVFVGAGGRF
ncbi:MAG: tetratricopeptide repeat protein [Myxococcota bacterium]